MLKTLTAATLWVAAFSVSAQVEVVDRPITNTNKAQQSSAPANNSNANVAELYYQFQVLQQEVQQLRGLVEEQNHQIKKLKQQRLDDYLDLDRRLSSLGSGSTAPAGASAGGSPVAGGAPSGNGVAQTGAAPVVRTPATAEDAAAELASYKKAINLLLKEQKHDEAIAALEKHLDQYPSGRYAGNAQYWLGEIYLVKNDLASAASWFEKLLADSPAHSKVPDAQFKLGKVYHMQGNNAAAKAMLEKVAATSSNAAQLAKDYLAKNF